MGKKKSASASNVLTLSQDLSSVQCYGLRSVLTLTDSVHWSLGTGPTYKVLKTGALVDLEKLLNDYAETHYPVIVSSVNTNELFVVLRRIS